MDSPPARPATPDQFAHACEKGDLKLVRAMLARGAKVQGKNQNGDTALHFACKKGSVDVARYLISKGASVHAKDNHGLSPLHVASYNGHLPVVKLLIGLDADIHAVNNNEWTPLHVASYKGHLQIVEHLVASGASLSAASNGWTPLHVACFEGNCAVAVFLVTAGASIHAKEKKGGTPLHWAAQEGRLEVCEMLLDRGADIHARNTSDLTPLHIACDWKHIEVVKLLIIRGANIHAADKDLWTPLHIACIMGHKSVAEFLVLKGADIQAKDKDGQTPLHVACYRGETEVAKYLVQIGADVNAQDSNMDTPLHWACSWGRCEITETLLMRGANVDAVDVDGDTPLHYACHKLHADIVELLLQHASLDFRNKVGETPLHYACRAQAVEIVSLLLNRGANVRISNLSDGASPLHVACVTGNVAIAVLLLSKGADIRARDVKGRTPLDAALPEVVQQLQAASARLGPHDSLEGGAFEQSRRTAASSRVFPSAVRDDLPRGQTEGMLVATRDVEDETSRIEREWQDNLECGELWNDRAADVSEFAQSPAGARSESDASANVIYIRREKRNEEVQRERKIAEKEHVEEEEVREWLSKMDLGMHYDKLVEHGCTSLRLAEAALDVAMLRQIGIVRSCHQKVILQAVDSLRSSTTVRSWLESICMGAYAGAFERSGCDSMVVLRTAIDDDALKEIGVANSFHRKTILGKLEQMGVFPRQVEVPVPVPSRDASASAGVSSENGPMDSALNSQSGAVHPRSCILHFKSGAVRRSDCMPDLSVLKSLPTAKGVPVEAASFRALILPVDDSSCVEFVSTLFQRLASRSEMFCYCAPRSDLTNPRARPGMIAVRRGCACIWFEAVFLAVTRPNLPEAGEEPLDELLRLLRLMLLLQTRRKFAFGAIVDTTNLVVVRVMRDESGDIVFTSSGYVSLWSSTTPVLVPGEGIGVLKRLFGCRAEQLGFVIPNCSFKCPLRLGSAGSPTVVRLDCMKERSGPNSSELFYALLEGGNLLAVLKSGVDEELRSEVSVLRELAGVEQVPSVLWSGNVQSRFAALMLPVGVDTLEFAESEPFHEFRDEERAEISAKLLEFGRDVNQALVSAHRRGIFHCAVIPQHIVLARLNGSQLRAVLVDWTNSWRAGSTPFADSGSASDCFASLSMLSSRAYGTPASYEKRDDFEGLFYTLLFALSGGSLPWGTAHEGAVNVLALKRELVATTRGWKLLKTKLAALPLEGGSSLRAELDRMQALLFGDCTRSVSDLFPDS